MEWLKKHPRLYAIGGALVAIGGGLAMIQGIWSLFSPKPLIPFILTNLATLPLLLRILGILIFSILTAFSVVLLIHIFLQTRPRKTFRNGIQPITIDEPEISIEIDKCSQGNSVIRYGHPVQTIEVAFTLNVKSPPINVADLQLYMGDEMLKLVSPTVPITQENSKGCYVAKYELSLATILKVPKDRRNNYRLCVVAMGQKWPSNEFTITIASAIELHATEEERQRQNKLLVKLHQEYILSHDGISPAMIARTAPLPKEWVEKRLEEMGETWRRDEYYP